MLGIPWWAWLVLVPIILVVLLRWAARGFRREVRGEFVAYLQDRFPHFEVIEEHDDHLDLKSAEGTESKLSLDKLYQAISNAKVYKLEDRRPIFEHFFNAMREGEALTSAPLSLAAHGERILPRLMRPNDLAEMQKAVGEVPHQAVAGLGLEVVYVIDASASVAYLTTAHLQELGIEQGALHDLAMANLRKRFAAENVRAAVAGSALVAIKSLDSFDAARILLVPEHLAAGEELLAGIPDRDTLTLLKPPAAAEAKGLKFLLTPCSDRLLLNRVVRIRNDGFSML